MTDVLRLDVEQADALAAALAGSAILIDADGTGIANALRRVDDLLSIDQIALRDGVVGRLGRVTELLRTSRADLEWRMAYVQARSASGLSIAAPQRDLAYQRMSLASVVAALAGDARRAALHELAIRAAVDPSVASRIAGLLTPEQLDELNEAIREDIDAFFGAAGHGASGIDFDAQLAQNRIAFDQVVADHSLLLAAFSHSHDGRQLLRETWAYDTGPVAAGDMAIALLRGVWDTDFLLTIANDVFGRDPYETPVATDFRDTNYLAMWPNAGLIVPELFPPRTAIVSALARNPEAAYEYLVEQHGYHRLTGEQGWAAGGASHNEAYDTAVAALLRAGLLDPTNADAITLALTRGPGRGTPLFESIAQHPLPGEATALAWAEVISTQWPRLAGADPSIKADPSDTGHALAALFAESDEAMQQVMASYAVFVEGSYTEGFAAGDAERARTLSADGFEYLDRAFDALGDAPTHDDLMLVRAAFSSLLGEGASAASAALALGGPYGWFFGLVADQAIGHVVNEFVPPPDDRYASSKEIMDSLFLDGQSPDDSGGTPPSPIARAVINGAFGAHPEHAARFADSPFVVDGVLAVPTGGTALEDFNDWMRVEVMRDEFFAPLLEDELRHLREAANVHTG